MINWFGYYHHNDGYGRFNYRMVMALRSLGLQVKAATLCHFFMPPKMQAEEGIDWNSLSITCAPPFNFQPLPGRQWVLTMTEGNRIPEKWVRRIEESGIERVIVPCQHNVTAFRDSGVTLPISVVPGGVDPDEFPLREPKRIYRPYTFLTFADRGYRKGWQEVWEAFYKAFGGKTTGTQEVRLLIKARPGPENAISWMSTAQDADPRIIYQVAEEEEMHRLYAQAHCLALPSRSEGWGMIHREAACTGLPVITQRYSGLDDGHTDDWSLVVEGGKIQPIPKEGGDHMLGEWMVADVDNLAQVMKWAYYSPETAEDCARKAARWLRDHQTWRHSALTLTRLIERKGAQHG